MHPSIIVYMNPWHMERSPAFRQLLIEPLSNISFEERSILDYQPGERSCPVVFCLDLPPQGLPELVHTPHTWIPMVDGIGGQSEFWENLPTYLKVVSFSERATYLAKNAGLRVHPVQYFADPRELPNLAKDRKRTLIYWNRSSVIELKVLFKLCELLEVKKLLVRHHLDSTVPDDGFKNLPSRHGELSIQYIPATMNRQDYIRCLQNAHYFVAPRHAEGVGVTFIEAMAQGCVVIALDNYTMNEYIEHGRNGFLISYDPEICRENMLALEQQRILGDGLIGHCKKGRLKFLGRLHTYRSLITVESLPSRELLESDYIAMSRQAREDHLEGFEHWRNGLSDYAEFILSKQLKGAISPNDSI